MAAAGAGKLKNIKKEKLTQKNKQKISIKITKEKNQGCTLFGSCLITGVKNIESPKWLKEKIISLGQKPISAIVDITNYVMFDLNRPLHAYDVDKIDKGIVVRNSKKGETFKALDNKDYKLENDMCVISDNSGLLGFGGIIGGTRSGTGLNTQNVLIEAAYLKKKIITSLVKNGPLEMKKNGDFCYFFNFNDEIEFVNSIKNSEENNAMKILDALRYAKKFSMFLINHVCFSMKHAVNIV